MKTNLYKHSNDEFIDVVKTSFSIRECLLKLNLKAAGGNYKCFHKRVKELNLSTEHFIDPRGWNSGKKFGPKRQLIDYLSNQYPIQTSALRKRLLNEGIKEHKCEYCGITEWNNQKTPLELDHINGNNQDNSLSNLRLLCPNCHAQTSTYRGKNKGKGRTSR